MKSATRKASGRITRSTEEWLMSRSCHSAWFSSAALRVAAQQAREPADPLAAHRVALVRHRRGALLALAERLLGLAHSRALQVPDLERDPLERAAPASGEAAEQRRVAVALHHLGGHRLGAEPEPRAAPSSSTSAARWASVPTAPESLPTAPPRSAALEPRSSAAQLLAPDQALEPEGDRLGVDAVRAADHRRAAVALGERPRRRAQRARASLEQQLAGLGDL